MRSTGAILLATLLLQAGCDPGPASDAGLTTGPRAVPADLPQRVEIERLPQAREVGLVEDRTALPDGRSLWTDARAQVRDGAFDDRPLYWRRLAMQAQFLTAGGADAAGVGMAADELLTLNWIGRGFADVGYPPDADVRVLVTGFDPFHLDRDIEQSNPSGLIALMLDGVRVRHEGLRIAFESMIFPVNYGDFDHGIVEQALVPWLEGDPIDLLVTISMGRDGFDLERFPAGRRSAEALDNQRVASGGSATRPVPLTLAGAPLGGPEFVEFSLPAAAMVAVEGPFAVTDNRAVTTLEAGPLAPAGLEALAGLTAVRGSGGGYLSNEISYRSLLLRQRLGSTVPTGHLHVPRVAGFDPERERLIFDQTLALLLAAIRALGPAGADAAAPVPES